MTDNNRYYFRPRSRRGSALVMGIVISIVITSIVMVISWTSATMTQSAGNYAKETRANYVAEGAAQRAYWRFKKDNTWRANPSGTPVTSAMTGSDTVDGLTYSYTLTCVGNTSAPVIITSTATYGSLQGQVHATLTAGSGLPPSAVVNTSGINFNNNTITVTGDLYSTGTIQAKSTDTFHGNITTTGNLSGSPTVSGTTTTSAPSVTVPSVATIYSSLTGSASTISTGSVSVLNFVSNPVLWANGNVTLASGLTVFGTGTLLVNGDLSLGADIGTSSSPQNFNIVVVHDFNPSKNVYLTGSLYIGHDFNCSGNVILTGSIVDNHNVAFNNPTTLVYATPPSFDPRGGGLTQSKFGGAAP